MLLNMDSSLSNQDSFALIYQTWKISMFAFTQKIIIRIFGEEENKEKEIKWPYQSMVSNL